MVLVLDQVCWQLPSGHVLCLGTLDLMCPYREIQGLGVSQFSILALIDEMLVFVF